jgi:hypothetical protein
MGDINRGQTLADSGDPVGQLDRLCVGQERVYQQGLPLAVNQRRRIRHPIEVVLAGRTILGCAGALPDEQLPSKG